MDFKSGDIIASWRGAYNAAGEYVETRKMYARINSAEGVGSYTVSMLQGKEFYDGAVKDGDQWVRVGNIADASRKNGMFFDSMTSKNPRQVIYQGVDTVAKFEAIYAGSDATNIIYQAGRLGLYDAELGWLTADGSSTGTPYYGIYSKSLFLNISGTSKFLVKQDANNYIQFADAALKIYATDFQLRSTNIGIKSGAAAEILLGHASDYASAKIGLRNDGSGKLSAGAITWDAAGLLKLNNNVQVSGNVIVNATGAVKINNAGAGASGFVLDAAGLRGYDTVLGLTFNLPTNGDKPTFSSGIIKEVQFEIYTSGVIQTSATVGDGTANSAGIRINNTGLYACEANQLLANANVKILSDGSASFKGAITAASGAIGGFTIGATSITSTNIGIHSGAAAQILLGHATDYASAVTGFKNDGSGKLAAGNIAWTAAGAITFAGAITSTATITGGTFQTAASGQRVIVDGVNNRIDFLNSLGESCGYIQGKYESLRKFLYISSGFGIDIDAGSINIKQGNLNLDKLYGDFTIGPPEDRQFWITGYGRITYVNAIPAAGNTGKILRSDGTSFTPAALAMADLPALTANKVLLSDADGRISASSVSNTALSYLDATSSIQTQLNAKATLSGTNSWTGANTFTENLIFEKELRSKRYQVTLSSTTLDATGKNFIEISPAASYTSLTNITGSDNQIVIITNASATYSLTIDDGTNFKTGVSLELLQWDTAIFIKSPGAGKWVCLSFRSNQPTS